VAPRGARRLLLLAVLALLVHLVHGAAGAALPFVEIWVSGGASAIAVVLGLWRVVARRDERVAWGFVTFGLACALLGDAAWTWLVPVTASRFPSAADPFYLTAYASVFAGLVLLARGRLPGFHATLWLDGLLGGLTLGAVAAALLYDRLAEAGAGDPRTVAMTLAYPLAHLLQVVLAAGVFGMYAWRPGRAWTFLLAGTLLGTVADGAYGYLEATGKDPAGGPIATAWAGAHLLVAWAAWQPPAAPVPVRREGRVVMVLPMAFAGVCVSLLAYGRRVEISDVAASLALVALTLVLLRLALTLCENARLLEHSRHEAHTDGLTGLPNRRRLMAELEEEMTRPGRLLVLYDLDGFKGYNDAFGHAEGDLLLARLGTRLAAAVAGHGCAFRLGGDEFCALVDGPGVVAAGAAALSGSGVVPSLGTVTLGLEANSATAALRLADERMYAAKRSARSGPPSVSLPA